MRKILFTTILISSVALVAFVANAQKEVAKSEVVKIENGSDLFLEVNGKKITLDEINSQTKLILQDVKDINFATLPKNVKEELLRKISSNVLLFEAAKKSNVENDESVKRQIQIMREQVMISAFLDKKIDSLISEEALKAEYAVVVARYNQKEEIKAKHILVDTEAQAKVALEKLNEGMDFTELAYKLSNDPVSKGDGGNLGYFTEEMMIPEFSKAAFALKEGEMSAPVKTVFGWHIIVVEDRRPKAAPAYEEILPKLKASLWQKKADEYIVNLIRSSDIKWMNEGKKEKLDFGL